MIKKILFFWLSIYAVNITAILALGGSTVPSADTSANNTPFSMLASSTSASLESYDPASTDSSCPLSIATSPSDNEHKGLGISTTTRSDTRIRWPYQNRSPFISPIRSESNVDVLRVRPIGSLLWLKITTCFGAVSIAYLIRAFLTRVHTKKEPKVLEQQHEIIEDNQAIE